MTSRALAGVAALVVTIAVATAADAQLQVRPAKFAWDKAGMLRATFEYRDAFDDPKVKKRLYNGLPVDIVMRGYVYPNGGGDPVALTAHSCRVAHDVWNEIYSVVVNGVKKPPVVNMKGVYRLCTDMVDLPIAEKAILKNPQNFFLAVKVEVNPVSAAVLKEIQRWVTRPLGVSGGISAGDALFASFVGVFMKKQVASADNVIEFKTASFPP